MRVQRFHKNLPELSRFSFSGAVSLQFLTKDQIFINLTAQNSCFCADLDCSGVHKLNLFSDFSH
jgi:hypothetical protein